MVHFDGRGAGPVVLETWKVAVEGRPARDLVQTLQNDEVRLDQPVLLYDGRGRRIYWIGSEEDSNFRCNAYLFQCGGQVFLIDPGSKLHFAQVRGRVEQVIDPARVTHIIVHHQDPDLCASIPDWLAVNPNIEVLTNSRAAVLLPHYGFDRSRITCTDDLTLALAGGGALRFIPAPFMHFPGAFVTYDTVSRYLFSGDIFAAVSGEWQLFVDDFERQAGFMELFHIDYMASNKALRSFVDSIRDVEIAAVLPQHGSIIRGVDVERARGWLAALSCGLDLIYPGV